MTEPSGPSRLEGRAGCVPIGPSGGATRPLKTAELVARGVVQSIVEQGLRTGDSLPAEPAMVEHFGVSRESVREGLRLLEVQGLLSIRRGPGGGPVVGAVDPADLGRMSSLFFQLAGGTYRELFDTWIFCEIAIAERAASNPDADERKRRMGPYVRFGAAPQSEAEKDAFVAAHTRFHSELASLAANRVLQLTLQTAGQIVSRHIVSNDDPRAMASTLEQDHVDLAKAVVDGKVTAARKVADRHISGVVAETTRRLGTGIDDLIDWR